MRPRSCAYVELYLVTGLYYLTCKLDVYCCMEWRPDRPPRIPPLRVSPRFEKVLLGTYLLQV